LLKQYGSTPNGRERIGPEGAGGPHVNHTEAAQMKVQDRSKAELRREIRDATECPDCNAAQGRPCIGPNGTLRESNHIARVHEAKEKGYARVRTYITVDAKWDSTCVSCGGEVLQGERVAKGPGLREGWSCRRCLDSKIQQR
jgi:hypothetical protein